MVPGTHLSTESIYNIMVMIWVSESIYNILGMIWVSESIYNKMDMICDRRRIVCVKRITLWMRSIRRAYDSGIWIWILSIKTFNGLPVYYGGDMYDSEDAEDDPLERARAAYVEDYNFDVPEGIELMAYNRRRPDGGEARSVDTVDMVPMCKAVSCVTRIAPDEYSDTSETDTTDINGSDKRIFVSGRICQMRRFFWFRCRIKCGL